MQRRACGVTNRVIQKAQPDSAIPVLFAPRRHHNVRPTDFSRNDERFLQWKLLPNISVQAYGASARAVPLAFQYEAPLHNLAIVGSMDESSKFLHTWQWTGYFDMTSVG